MEEYCSFAGITFRILGPEGRMHIHQGDLSHFFIEEQEADYTLEFRLEQRLSEPEGACLFQDAGSLVYGSGDREICYKGPVVKGPEGAYLRIDRQGQYSSVQVKTSEAPNEITAKIVLNSLETEHCIVQNRGILLHASFIDHEGSAILFTAPSGTGKSTQADLWCRLQGAELVNGDRAAVVRDGDTVTAHGVPYSGSSGVCRNRSLPLQAIVYLSQAKKTTIQRLSGLAAFRRVWEGCCVNTWNRDDVETCTQTVLDLVETVPVFHLACTPDESAVIALNEALKELK